MLTLNDGRSELWQWDTGRKLSVDADCSQVHFSNKVFGRSIDVDVIDGVAIIPDILLQTDKDLNVWAFVGTSENGYTKISKTFKVNRRNKPADYVFTPPEQTTLSELVKRLDRIEEIQDPDAIKNAVEDYLEQNPVEAPVQSVNGKTGKVELTAENVGAISRGKLQEATNEALAQAKASGEFDGKDGKDGYTPLKGVDYFDGQPGQPGKDGEPGNDYILTEADKQEIAEQAAELVEVPEPDLTGVVKSVNGVTPDENGNVEISVSGGTEVTTVEPAEDDIPKVFFGGALQQTKTEKVVSFRYISKTQDISGYAEIKAQGNSSMSYPKKNQTVKMFKDAECTEKMKVDFKGWGKQNKHCYKANWIDLTHSRNIVSARIWADIVKSRADYESLPELLRTSPNQGAVDGFPVKVYADGVYQGRYTVNIPKDKWMANMDDELDTHCILCGEGYNSGCFRSASTAEWTDEIHDSMPSTISTRWVEVINFVMNSNDVEFKTNLGNYFDVQSLIDYHLYGLASCGLDAYGKNQLYMTYDGQRWIASMYDMDSTCGLYWNGSKFVATDYARTSYEDMVSGRQGNLLYIRLEQLFSAELQTRWAELKQGALSIENIINRFERFTDIVTAELVKEDYASTTGGGKFTGIPSKDTNNIQQIRAFALARQAWTDTYVAGLTQAIPVPCEGITLDKSELAFDGEGTQTITATVTPSDTTDNVVWVSSNPAIASIAVEGNVCTVQSVNNGNAVITVTCGNHSASCSVSVSGIAEPLVLYSLSEETTFDGVDDYIDTGLHLFQNGDRDFSVFIDFQGYDSTKGLATILSSSSPVSPYPGFVIRHGQPATSWEYFSGTSYGVKPSAASISGKVVLTHEAGSGKVNIYTSELDAKSASISIEEIDNTVLLGCGYSTSGLANFWNGVIYACEIYSKALNTDEAIEKLGIPAVDMTGKWSDTSNVTVNKTTGEVVSGRNYVSDAIEIPAGTNKICVFNLDPNANFTWIGTWEYDENMAFITGGEVNNAGNRIIEPTENAKFIRVSAFPNVTACNNPEAQICVAFYSD